MNAADLLQSKYIEAEDFEGKTPTLTILGISREALDDGGEPKGVISFRETARRWVLNKTNIRCLRAMFGGTELETSWKGKRVTLHAVLVSAFGETRPGIRVMGSPDITRPIDVKVSEGRKRKTIRLIPTGTKKGKQSEPVSQDEAAAIAAAEREPGAEG